MEPVVQPPRLCVHPATAAPSLATVEPPLPIPSTVKQDMVVLVHLHLVQ